MFRAGGRSFDLLLRAVFSDFYSSFFGIPVAGATLPVLAFFMLGIYGKLIWLVLSAVILGIGHIGIHLAHRKEREVFDLDPSIGALKNVPCGCQVERKTPDDSWVIVYQETDEPIANKELSVCEICGKVKTVDHFYPAPKAYFDCLRYIQTLVDSGDFEFEFKDCDTDKVKDENEHWINDVICHVIKCKNCGQYFTCFADTYHGDGYFRIGKSEYR